LNLHSEKGLTLSELLIASFVSVVAFTSILGALSNITLLNELNRDKTLGSLHCQYVMEKIRGAAFTGLEADINSGTWDLTTAQLSKNPYNLTVLNSESIDTSVIQSGDPLYLKVEISWQDRRDSIRTYSLETLRTD